MDDRALDDLLSHGTWLRRLAAKLVDDADADDAVQDVWMAALRRPPELDRPVRPWLAEVVRNLLRSRHRAETRRRVREITAHGELRDEPLPTPEELLEQHQRLRALADAIAGLDEPYRSTLLLHHAEGLASTEIARRLGVPGATIRWRLLRARELVRKALDEADGDGRSWRVVLAPLARRERRAPLSPAARRWPGTLGAAALVGAAATAVTLHRAAPRPAPSVSAPRPTTTLRPRLGQAAGPAVLDVTVGGPDGGPLAAAVVAAVPRDATAPTLLARARRLPATGPGRFRAELPAGDWELVASCPGLVPQAKPVRTTANASVAASLQLAERAFPLTGTITDATGLPVAAAILVARELGRSSPALPSAIVAESDVDGRYRLDLAAGVYGISITHDGYAPGEAFAFVVGPERRDFVVDGGSQIAARVVDDGGHPVAGAEASLTVAGPTPRVLRSATTNADGRVSFADVPAGAYHVVAARAGLVGVGPLLRLGGEDRAVTPDLALVPGGSVVGRVRGPDGPLAGARVSLRSESAALGSGMETVSDGDGAFRLRGALPGEHTLRIEAPGFLVRERVVRTYGEEVALQDAALVVDASPARGTREDDRTAEVSGLLIGPDGAPVAGGKVLAAVGTRAWVTLADAHGRFGLRLPPGLALVAAAGDATAWPASATSWPDLALFPLGAGERRGGLVLESSPSGRDLSGEIVDRAGRPVAGVEITARLVGSADWVSDTIASRALTDGNGRFRLRAVAGRSLELDAFHPRFAELRTIVDEAAGSPRLVVVEGASIEVRVRGLRGAASVLVTRSGRGRYTQPQAVVDEVALLPGSDRFVLDGLASDDYDVEAVSGGCLVARASVHVEPGERAHPVELALARGASIRGRLSSIGDEGAIATLVAGGQLMQVPVTPEGTFDFRCVPAGGEAHVTIARKQTTSSVRLAPLSAGDVDVGTMDATGLRRARLGIDVVPSPQGLEVVFVEPGLAGAGAGLAVGDRLLVVAGKSARDLQLVELKQLLTTLPRVELTVASRSGHERAVTIELEGAP